MMASVTQSKIKPTASPIDRCAQIHLELHLCSNVTVSRFNEPYHLHHIPSHTVARSCLKHIWSTGQIVLYLQTERRFGFPLFSNFSRVQSGVAGLRLPARHAMPAYYRRMKHVPTGKKCERCRGLALSLPPRITPAP